MFTLERALPCPALADIVDTYYLITVDLPPGQALEDVMLPELPNIRFQLEGQWHLKFGDAPFVPAHSENIFGFTHAPYQVRVAGKSRVFGIGLKPLGWQSIINRPASALSDSLCSLVDIFGQRAKAVGRQMQKASTVGDMAVIADACLLSVQQPVSTAKRSALNGFSAALTEPLIAEINRVDELAMELDLSMRQVERYAKELFGCSPKLLLRKHRFLSMLSRSGEGEAGQSWLDEADESFYDQSHYIREYKRFTGRSPQQFAKSPNMLQRHVVQSLKTLPERKRSAPALKLDLALPA